MTASRPAGSPASSRPRLEPAHTITTVLTTASELAGLTVLVYRLGVWQAEMQHTKSNVGAEVVRLREESRADFARLERRFVSVEQSGLTALDRRVGQVEHREVA